MLDTPKDGDRSKDGDRLPVIGQETGARSQESEYLQTFRILQP
jgi:hypothetical protein